MRVKKGQQPAFFSGWDEKTFKPAGTSKKLEESDPKICNICYNVGAGSYRTPRRF